MHLIHYRNLFGLASALCLMGAVTVADAEVYMYEFDTVITGTQPDGFNIASLTIEDLSENSVLVTLNHHSTSPEGLFISRLWFNLNPSTPLDQFDVSPINFVNGSIVTGGNALNVAGYSFDLMQRFNTTNVNGGSNRLQSGDSVSFVLSADGLSASDFNLAAQGNNDPLLFALIQLQGPGSTGARLGAMAPVPEPATMAALGVGLLALARKRRKS